MDIICTCCGQPWDMYHVLHEEPQGFDREGALIKACPCCHGEQPDALNRHSRRQLGSLAEAAGLFGDDLDGFAAFLEDVLLIDLLTN